MPYPSSSNKTLDPNSVPGGNENLQKVIEAIDKEMLAHNFRLKPSLKINMDRIPEYQPWMLDSLWDTYQKQGWHLTENNVSSDSNVIEIESLADVRKRADNWLEAQKRKRRDDRNTYIAWTIVLVTIAVAYFLLR